MQIMFKAHDYEILQYNANHWPQNYCLPEKGDATEVCGLYTVNLLQFIHVVHVVKIYLWDDPVNKTTHIVSQVLDMLL
jgi:hypothetical protein